MVANGHGYGSWAALDEALDVEQVYYILAGEMEVCIEDDRFPVREGSVTYFPPSVKHQLIGESQLRVLNWRDATPTLGNHGKAVIWKLLKQVEEEEKATDQPCLLAFHYLTRQAVGCGQASDMH